MIKADAISRMYGDFVAVKGVSFEIGPREIVGLLGHNGAGKTTIMKMITGYLEPTAGNLTVNGLNVVDDRLEVQRQIGYLPENCPLYPDMTVIDYLQYAASLKAIPPSLVSERLTYAIKKTSLAEVATRQISTLSRGYRQRLGVAQAILHSPKLLILDEPTNGLDPSQILEMRSLIRELATSATVVVSTHILQEVQAVCRRVIIINRGCLALDQSMSALRAAGQLELTSDVAPDRLSQLIADLAGLSVFSHERQDNSYRYTLDLSGQECEQVAPRLAKTIVDSGANLYAMHPIVRDLETIFREISAGHRVDDSTDATAEDEKASADAGDAAALSVGGTTGDGSTN